MTEGHQDRDRISAREVRKNRRTRRHPRPTQFDYLHLRSLVGDLAAVLARVPAEQDVLDIYCGSRPYEDLLPERSRCTGLDIDDRYGTADVVSRDFLPFPDASFDLVVCVEGFQYVPDPVQGMAEIERVLRPGGRVIITVAFMWQYNRTILEHRYTGPELAELLRGWDRVEVVENGGHAVTWATLTGRMLDMLQRGLGRFVGALLWPLFALGYLLTNGVGDVADRVERRHFRGPHTLPMNLLVTATRSVAAGPAGGGVGAPAGQEAGREAT
jgi:SAM-dependent methyltransferase